MRELARVLRDRRDALRDRGSARNGPDVRCADGWADTCPAALAPAAAATAGLLIAVFALFGRILLSYLNVSIQSLAIAGGLLLLLVALEMFRGRSGEVSGNVNIVLVPLATPLLAGPGAIAAVMVLANRHSDVAGRIGVTLGVVAVVAAVAVILLLAGQLARLLRPAFVDFLTRVLALLLSAIAVQLVVDAVRALIVGAH